MSLRTFFVAALCALTAGGCSSGSNIKETLGLDHKAPDEFRVYARPPLTVPPDFSLRAPGSSSGAPSTTPADVQARSTVTGTADSPVAPVAAHDMPSGADEQFLRNAGAERLSPDVRTQIKAEGETALESKNSNYLINPSAGGEPTVDAKKESDRLKENKAQNKPLTEGDTPVVQPKSNGLLGTLGDLF